MKARVGRLDWGSAHSPRAWRFGSRLPWRLRGEGGLDEEVTLAGASRGKLGNGSAGLLDQCAPLLAQRRRGGRHGLRTALRSGGVEGAVRRPDGFRDTLLGVPGRCSSGARDCRASAWAGSRGTGSCGPRRAGALLDVDPGSWAFASGSLASARGGHSSRRMLVSRNPPMVESCTRTNARRARSPGSSRRTSSGGSLPSSREPSPLRARER